MVEAAASEIRPSRCDDRLLRGGGSGAAAAAGARSKSASPLRRGNGNGNGDDEGQGGTSRYGRGIISPATVVHLKSVLGRAADRAQDRTVSNSASLGRNSAAFLDDEWNRVRPGHAAYTPGVGGQHGVAASEASNVGAAGAPGPGSGHGSSGENRPLSGYFGAHNARGRSSTAGNNAPQNSSDTFLSPHLISQEPGSYVTSPLPLGGEATGGVDAGQAPAAEEEYYTSDDSHSGDEYAHLNKRRRERKQQQRQRKTSGSGVSGPDARAGAPPPGTSSFFFTPRSPVAPPPPPPPLSPSLGAKRTPSANAGRATAQPDSRFQRFLDLFRLPDLTAQQRGVLKCSIAYFIATLFTFVPFLSDLFAAPFELEGNPVAGAHVIATVATYYNPAKTLGSMFEADIFMLWASSFALVACLGPMCSAYILEDAGHHKTSHLVVVWIWLVGAMGLVAWMKAKMSNAQFGSACSMVALILTSVICKEGSIHAGVFQLQTISQTFATVFLGTFISNVVCIFVWRGSATSKLQGDINKTLESFSTLLDLLCHSFLNEDTPISDETLRKSIDAHRASFTALKTSLGAAKLELWDYRIQRTMKNYDQIVASMNRLAQHLTGVRSAVIMERELDVFRDQQARERKSSQMGSESGAEQRRDTEGDNDIMATFQQHVGPSLRTLGATLRQSLRDVRTSFVQSRAGEKSSAAAQSGDVETHANGLGGPGAASSNDGLERMKQGLDSALSAYKTAHTKSIKRLYRHYPSNLSDEQDFLQSRVHPQLDHRPNEEVFLIYHFCYNIEEFAREQVKLIDAFRAVHEEERSLEAENRSYRDRFGSWAAWVQACDVGNWWGEHTQHVGKTHRWATLKTKLVQLMPLSSDKAPSPFPAVDDKAVTSHSAAQEARRDVMTRLRRRIWRFGLAIKKPDVLYAIKAGLGCGVMGAFAFDHRTRPTFVEYSGNWAMLSYMVVVSTTIGATNFNAFFRIAGTILGAATATVAWFVMFGHPVLLCIFSFLFSIPCFWVIVTRPKFATSGRFVLLSYNLTALYAYNVRDTNYDVQEIAFHRTVAVTVGTLWGLFVTRYIFPFEARRELRDGVSELLLQMGYFYQKLVEHVSLEHAPSDAIDVPPPQIGSSTPLGAPVDVERVPLLRKTAAPTDPNKAFAEMEMHLQISLIKLGTLLEHARHEPRMKGPFPVGPYASVLQTCQRMLDTLHSMRTVALRPDFGKVVRKELLLPSSQERREVTGNILLFLSLLASDLALKAPLPPYLPPAEASRLRLIAKISTLPLVKQRAVRGTSAFLLYYSYALQEKDLIASLEKVGAVFQYLFGVMGDLEGSGAGVESFEELFVQRHTGSRQLRQSRNGSASSVSTSRTGTIGCGTRSVSDQSDVEGST